MKALGAGGIVAALGGCLGDASGDAGVQDEETDTETGTDDAGTGTDTDDGDDGGADDEGGTVHTINTLITGPPSNPERPADFFYQPTGLHVQPGDVIRFHFVTPDHNVVSYHPAFGMRRRVPTGVDAISSPLMGYRPDSIPGDQIEPPGPPEGEGGDGAEMPTATDGTAETATDGMAETATATDGMEGTTTAGETPGTATTDGEPGNGTEPPTGGGEQPAGPVPDQWLLGLDEPGVYDMLCSPHEGFGMAMRIVVGDETEAPFETSDPEALPEPRVGPVGLARVTLTDPALEPSNIVEQGTVPWQALEANQAGGEGGGDETATGTAATDTPG